MTALPRIMVAPNGARLTPADHPALPITQDEIVACTRACFAAGAHGLHAHIRDATGQHLLDAQQYRNLCAALREAVPDMAVQITTEAAGIFGPEVQMQVALTSGANMVSASVREICRAGPDEARRFYRTCADQGIAVQHILYDRSDCTLLEETLDPADVQNPALQLIFVLGRYSATNTSDPAELNPFVAWLKERGLTPDWAVCAFGPAETQCLVKAATLGGKCRVGFENSLYLSDGSLAKDNAEKVTDLRAAIRAAGVRL